MQIGVTAVVEPAVIVLCGQHERQVLLAEVVLRVPVLAAHDDERLRDVVDAVAVLAARSGTAGVLVQSTRVSQSPQLREERGPEAALLDGHVHETAGNDAATSDSAIRW